MKNILALTLAVLLMAVLTITVLAAESTFTVLTDAESEFVYKNEGTWDAGDSRVGDQTQYIIYVFSLSEGDTWASVEFTICNQYKIEAATNNPDDAASYTIVAEQQPTEQEKTDGLPFWGTAAYEKPTRFDLSDFCRDNSTGKIYVKVSDAVPDNGWGPKIYNTSSVVFSHGTGKDIPEVQCFTVGGEDESRFIYLNDRTWVDANNRICDNDTTVTYVFDLVENANFAQLEINIHNQYKIEVADDDPGNPDSYTILEQLEIPSDADLEAEPWWGSSDDYTLHTIDLSDYCSTGRIYVKIGDVTPDTGWGGKIEGEVKFTSKALAEESIEAEEPQVDEEPVATTVDEELDTKAEAPNTFDLGVIAGVAAVLSLAGFVGAKKR